MGSWSSSSSQWANTSSPYITLNVTTTADGYTKDTISWSLVLNRPSNISSSASKSWSVTVADQTWSGSTTVGGSGAKTIATGSKSITKNTSTQNFSGSATLNIAITWSGSYKSSISTSLSFYSDPLPSYTVSYNANGGSGAPSSQTKWYGTNITLSSTKPTRTGYTFAGWATSSTGSVAYAAGATYSANAGVTLYAKWTAITYTVSYNANGGSGAPSSQTKTYGVNLTLSTTKPTRTNYNFKGWATSASGSVAYAAGATYSSNAAITLYAVWELAYVAPRITSVTVNRCDSSGTTSSSGTYAAITFTWATDKTVSSIQLKYKRTTATSWSSATTVSATGTSGTVSKKVIGGGALSADYSYGISIYVADSTGNTTITRTISGATYPIDFLAGNKGVAIGKAAETSNLFDVNLPSTFNSNVEIKGWLSIDNNKQLYVENASGTYRSAMIMNSSNNLHFGSGAYDNSDGNVYYNGNYTAVRAKGNVDLISGTNVRITAPSRGLSCRSLGENVVLWSGTMLLSTSQTATLSAGVSAQPNGIVLIWSYYANSAAQNMYWYSYFIPKYLIANWSNQIHMNVMEFDAKVAAKTMYITNTTIKGASDSNSTNDVIKSFVLRYVLGV